jgi:cell division protein FtsB
VSPLLPNRLRPGRVKRRPLHAAKRARRRRLQLMPRSQLMPRLQLPMDTDRRARLGAKLRARLPKPSSPVPALLALVSRWRSRRAALSLEHRRARTVLASAIVLAALILLTSFPLAGVLSQRSALSSTARQLNAVQAENQSLGRQASQLAAPSTLNDLARHDFGFVPKGQRAYNVLPSSSPSGSGSSSSLGPDQVPLNGPPVVPGSARSQALIGVAAAGGAPAPRPTDGTSAAAGSALSGEPRSYWGRVVRSLEFWN